MANFQELYDFVDRAKRNRKYPEATAHSLRAALKLYDTELNNEERASLTKVRADFEQITRSVFNKNSVKFTTGSLATYKSRVQKVLADYEKYGDPTKMNSWSPKVINRTKKTKQHEVVSGAGVLSNEDLDNPSEQPNVFSDKGTGWSLVIKSKKPVSSEIKKKIVDVADLLNQTNKESN